MSSDLATGAVERADVLHPVRGGKRFRLFALFAGALGLAYGRPLYELVGYALNSDLHSYIILIPFVSAYLVRLKHRSAPEPSSSPALAMIPLSVGLVALNGWRLLAKGTADHFTLGVFSFLALLLAGALLILGGRFLRAYAFPVAFLIFMVPMPSFFRHGIEVFLQHASADAAAALFAVSGSTVYREGLGFQLPGIVLQVAEECSGIRSTVVLFITSLVAGYLFLRTPWKRAVLALIVIPLAVIRNGLRVFTIGMLCVHVDPSMIDSPIHKRGGPLFFALSLIPFFIVLLWLRRTERVRAGTMPPADKTGSTPIQATE